MCSPPAGWRTDHQAVILTLVAALDADGAIGLASGGMPWHLPAETAHFRALCTRQWLLVGRRTFEEMNGWFQPGHRVIVMTRGPAPATPATPPPHPAIPVRTAASAEAALTLARAGGADAVLVIGGACVYAAMLPAATRLVLSRIHLHSGGDVFFPQIDPADWILSHAAPRQRDPTTGMAFTIETWQRAALEPPPPAR